MLTFYGRYSHPFIEFHCLLFSPYYATDLMYLTIASPTSHFAIKDTLRTEKEGERETDSGRDSSRAVTRRIYETGSRVSPLSQGKKLDRTRAHAVNLFAREAPQGVYATVW